MKNDKMPYNDNYQPHGYWERYHYNGELWYKCVYINGKVNGFDEIHWYDDATITHKNYYL